MKHGAGVDNSIWTVLFLAVWLGIMSASDLGRRRVSNWLTMPPLLAILGWQLAHGRWQALLPLPLIYTLWLLRVVGGADAKVLMALFALHPGTEFALFFCLGYAGFALTLLGWRRWRLGRALTGTRTPAVPIYSLLALAYQASSLLRQKG